MLIQCGQWPLIILGSLTLLEPTLVMKVILDINRFWIIRLLKVFVTQYNVADGYMPADADYNGITFKVNFKSALLSLLHIMTKYLSSLQIPGGPVQRKDQVQRTDFLLSNQR